MNSLEVILDNIIHLCTNKGLNKLELKLEIENKLSDIDLANDKP